MQTDEASNAEVIAMPGLKTRMAAYQHNTTNKKKHSAEKGDKKKRVGKLQQKLLDPGQFESPAAGVKAHKPVFQVENSGTSFDTENAQSNDQSTEPQDECGSPTRRRNNHSPLSTSNGATATSPTSKRFQPHQRAAPPAPTTTPSNGGTLQKADYDLRPEAVQRSTSFDSDDVDCARAMYGAIARNHGDTERERVAKSRLNTLLQREMRDEKVAHNYAACRVRYLRAVGNLRPGDYYGDMNDSFSVQEMGLAVPSPDVRQRRREKRKTEKEKKGRYDELKETWHSYDDVALDKPMVPTPEEAELEKDLDEIEEEIHEEWEDFAEDVLAMVEEEKEAGIEEEDPDIQEWRQEQIKLQDDKEKRKKRKEERAKKREKFVEEKRKQEALEAERQKKEEETRMQQVAKEKAEQEAQENQAREKLEKEGLEKKEMERLQAAEEAVKADDVDHDADNEHEDSPPGKRGRKSKHRKKKHASRHDKHEKSVEEIDEKATADIVEGMGAEERPDEYMSDLASETSGSLALQSDAAFKRGGKNMEHLGKYFGDDDTDDKDEEEEDILASVEVDEKDRDEKPKIPNRQKSVDMIDLPSGMLPNVANTLNNGQSPAPRKKKELRIEYDNGIPKEISIIMEGKSNKIEDYDDCSYSTISGSESEESESSCSVISAGDEDFDLGLSPRKDKNGVKKSADRNAIVEVSPKRKQKLDLLRIDTLPAQQFYDGTEESPFVAWTHRPLKTKIDGSQITVKVPPRTDCWRKTRHNFIMDNAPFYWHRVNGDFEVMVKVSGDMKKMYDKAGIMIRLDAENWICSGLEYFNNELNHMTCVTRDYTDWSMAPVAPEAKSQGAWICIKRIGNAYESFCSMDGRNWRQARQGLFTDAKSVRVGVFCASPMGETYKVTFDKYRCKNLTM
mmetsp:Transcript_9208/g.17576  ORF Transcript_9208/g.17576 Transcript_9208/m.17576 type:complete len:904 (+) Transcript_9208:155-2866(+)